MNDLPTSVLGRTGLEVTKLGFGAAELWGVAPKGTTPTEKSGRVLHAILDAGINFIDTAPCYGFAEERIGAFISGRRHEFYLASKCGCPVNQPDPPPGEWPSHVFTRQNITDGVEQSLRRMKTDHLDLVQFHGSPSRSEMEDNDSIAELLLLKEEGKVRFIGMSGNLPNLPGQIAMGVFDAFQIPYSALDRGHEELIQQAADAGAGTIIRGGLARGIPALSSSSIEEQSIEYRQWIKTRVDYWQRTGLDDLLDGMSRMEFMLRFTISHPGMTTTIVGTANTDHIADNLAAACKGPLPDDLYATAKEYLDKAAA